MGRETLPLRACKYLDDLVHGGQLMEHWKYNQLTYCVKIDHSIVMDGSYSS